MNLTMRRCANTQFKIKIDLTIMTWNDGHDTGIGGQGEIKFEKKEIRIRKEDVIGICGHRECQETTKDAELTAVGHRIICFGLC